MLEEVAVFVGKNSFFFSKNHLQRFKSDIPIHDEYILVTYPVPYKVKPRDGLESGLCFSCDNFRILYKELREVLNPDPLFVVCE